MKLVSGMTPAKLNIFAYIILANFYSKLLNIIIIKKFRNFNLEIKKAPHDLK